MMSSAAFPSVSADASPSKCESPSFKVTVASRAGAQAAEDIMAGRAGATSPVAAAAFAAATASMSDPNISVENTGDANTTTVHIEGEGSDKMIQGLLTALASRYPFESMLTIIAGIGGSARTATAGQRDIVDPAAAMSSMVNSMMAASSVESSCASTEVAETTTHTQGEVEAMRAVQEMTARVAAQHVAGATIHECEKVLEDSVNSPSVAREWEAGVKIGDELVAQLEEVKTTIVDESANGAGVFEGEGKWEKLDELEMNAEKETENSISMDNGSDASFSAAEEPQTRARSVSIAQSVISHFSGSYRQKLAIASPLIIKGLDAFPSIFTNFALTVPPATLLELLQLAESMDFSELEESAKDMHPRIVAIAEARFCNPYLPLAIVRYIKESKSFRGWCSALCLNFGAAAVEAVEVVKELTSSAESSSVAPIVPRNLTTTEETTVQVTSYPVELCNFSDSVASFVSAGCDINVLCSQLSRSLPTVDQASVFSLCQQFISAAASGMSTTELSMLIVKSIGASSAFDINFCSTFSNETRSYVQQTMEVTTVTSEMMVPEGSTTTVTVTETREDGSSMPMATSPLHAVAAAASQVGAEQFGTTVLRGTTTITSPEMSTLAATVGTEATAAEMSSSFAQESKSVVTESMMQTAVETVAETVATIVEEAVETVVESAEKTVEEAVEVKAVFNPMKAFADHEYARVLIKEVHGKLREAKSMKLAAVTETREMKMEVSGATEVVQSIMEQTNEQGESTAILQVDVRTGGKSEDDSAEVATIEEGEMATSSVIGASVVGKLVSEIVQEVQQETSASQVVRRSPSFSSSHTGLSVASITKLKDLAAKLEAKETESGVSMSSTLVARKCSQASSKVSQTQTCVAQSTAAIATSMAASMATSMATSMTTSSCVEQTVVEKTTEMLETVKEMVTEVLETAVVSAAAEVLASTMETKTETMIQSAGAEVAESMSKEVFSETMTADGATMLARKVSQHFEDSDMSNMVNDMKKEMSLEETKEETAEEIVEAVVEEVKEAVVEAVVEEAVVEEVKEMVVEAAVEEAVVEAVVEEAVVEEVKEAVVEAIVEEAVVEEVKEAVVEAIVEEAVVEEVKEAVVEAIVEEAVVEEVKEIVVETAVEEAVVEAVVEEVVVEEVKEAVVEEMKEIVAETAVEEAVVEAIVEESVVEEVKEAVVEAIVEEAVVEEVKEAVVEAVVEEAVVEEVKEMVEEVAVSEARGMDLSSSAAEVSGSNLNTQRTDITFSALDANVAGSMMRSSSSASATVAQVVEAAAEVIAEVRESRGTSVDASVKVCEVVPSPALTAAELSQKMMSLQVGDTKDFGVSQYQFQNMVAGNVLPPTNTVLSSWTIREEDRSSPMTRTFVSSPMGVNTSMSRTYMPTTTTTTSSTSDLRYSEVNRSAQAAAAAASVSQRSQAAVNVAQMAQNNSFTRVAGSAANNYSYCQPTQVGASMMENAQYIERAQMGTPLAHQASVLVSPQRLQSQHVLDHTRMSSRVTTSVTPEGKVEIIVEASPLAFMQQAIEASPAAGKPWGVRLSQEYSSKNALTAAEQIMAANVDPVGQVNLSGGVMSPTLAAKMGMAPSAFMMGSAASNSPTGRMMASSTYQSVASSAASPMIAGTNSRDISGLSYPQGR